MFKNKAGWTDEDKALESLEQSATGRLLHTMGQQIKPRPEFASHTEERLRQNKSHPAIEVPPYVPTQRRQEERASYRIGGRPGSRRIGLALTGLGLAAAMVIVMGLLTLPTRNSGTARADQVPSVLAGSPLAQGVLVSAWDNTRRSAQIRAVDPATGEMLPGYAPIEMGKYTTGSGTDALSPNSGKAAVIESKTRHCFPSGENKACFLSADVLHLVDLQAWSSITTTIDPPFPVVESHRGWVQEIAFSRDSARVALGYNMYKYSGERFQHAVLLFDSSSGKSIAQKEIEFQPTIIEFSQDGSSLIVYGQSMGSNWRVSKPGPPQLLVLDAKTLDVQWSQTFSDIVSGTWCVADCEQSFSHRLFEEWTPAVVPSHDRSKLYILHADSDTLTTVDLEARTVRSMDGPPATQSWFERLLDMTASKAEARGNAKGVYKHAALSADGTQLYVVGMSIDRDTASENQPLGLEIINVDNGHSVASLDSDSTHVQTSYDGAYLFLAGLQPAGQAGRYRFELEVVDIKRMQRVATMEHWEVVPSRRLGGEPIILAWENMWPSGNSARLGVLDPKTFHVAHSWDVDKYAEWVTTP
jgi:hypothetical protein